jgi:outer membrane protein
MAFRLILSVLLFSSVAFAANSDKDAETFAIAVVDIERALAVSEAGQNAQKDYQKEVKARQKELDAKKAKFDKLKESLEKQHKSLSKEALREKAAELDRMDKEVTRLYQDSQEELRRRNAVIVADLLRDLRKVVLAFGKENNYKMILDKGSDALLFADKTVDVTQEVIDRFNESQK